MMTSSNGNILAYFREHKILPLFTFSLTVLYMVSRYIGPRNIESLLHLISIATSITNRYHVLDIDSNDWLTRWGQKLINLHHDEVIKWNIFRATCPLRGEFTGHRWILLTKASDAELWCFPWSAPEQTVWVNNRDAGDLRPHRAHYDVIWMMYFIAWQSFYLNQFTRVIVPKD